MSLAWHMAKKDLRRMALPVALWCVFIALATAGWDLLRMHDYGHRSLAAAYDWIGLVDRHAGLLMFVQACTGALLVACFVQEEPLSGTTAHWMTRPISGRRLLRAKLIGAALLFVAFPTAAASLGWLANGFSAREFAWAAIEFAGFQVAIITIALGLAALTTNLGAFIGVGLALASVVAVALVVGGWWRLITGFHGGAAEARAIILLVLPVGMTGVFVGRYLAPRRPWGWVVFGAILGLIAVTRVGWRGEPPKFARAFWHPAHAMGDIPATATELKPAVTCDEVVTGAVFAFDEPVSVGKDEPVEPAVGECDIVFGSAPRPVALPPFAAAEPWTAHLRHGAVDPFGPEIRRFAVGEFEPRRIHRPCQARPGTAWRESAEAP